MSDAIEANASGANASGANASGANASGANASGANPSNGDDAPIESAVRRVAAGVGDAVGQAKLAASQAGDGIGELRKVIRGQPLTMGFLAIGIGYLLGHLSSRSLGR